MKITEFLKFNYGYDNSVRSEAEALVPLWQEYETGNVKDFHKYHEGNGIESVEKKRLTMKLAAKVAQDKADLQFNQKTKITLADKSSNEMLEEILTNNDFWVNFASDVKEMYSTGMIANVIRVVGIGFNENHPNEWIPSGKVFIDSVDVLNIFPLSYDRTGVQECAFTTIQTKNGKNYVCLTVHKLDDNNNYVIYNHLFDDKENELEIDGAFSIFPTMSNVKWFSLVHTPERITRDNQFYKSAFADCLDELKSLDNAFTEAFFEIYLSRKIIFQNKDMLDCDNNGKPTGGYDKHRFYYLLNETLANSDNKNKMIEEFATAIRNTSYWEEIKNLIALIGSKCGLGKLYDPFGLRMANVAYETFEAAISESLIRRDTDWHSIESGLFDIINAVIYASNTFCGTNINPDGLAIAQDTTIYSSPTKILADTDKKLNMGIISKAEARAAVTGESLETAQQQIKLIEEEKKREQNNEIDKILQGGA